ncbi:Dedicator of cytokinesis protein 9, partial [Araneus ventricosus]
TLLGFENCGIKEITDWLNCDMEDAGFSCLIMRKLSQKSNILQKKMMMKVRMLLKHFGLDRNAKVPDKKTILFWVRNFRRTSSALKRKPSDRPHSIRTSQQVEAVRQADLHNVQPIPDERPLHSDRVTVTSAHYVDMLRNFLQPKLYEHGNEHPPRNCGNTASNDWEGIEELLGKTRNASTVKVSI